MDNYGRINLITRFTCSVCGDQLSLSYDTKKPTSNGYQDDGITGAAKIENYVSVEPCKKCINKYKEPIEQIQKALKLEL